MKKRTRGAAGDRSLAAISARIQRHDLVSSELDVVLHSLRAQYADYGRLKLQPFTHLVRRALESLRRSSCASAAPPTEEDSSNAAGPARKVPRRSTSSSASSGRLLRYADPSSDSVPDFYDKCSTFTSDDVATESEAEQPEFDLMKTMLRDSYIKRRKPAPGPTPAAKKAHDAVMERADEKPYNMVCIDGRDGVDGKWRSAEDGCGKVMGDENDWEGPTFQDFGGMKVLLDKLEMEIIVPLARPEMLSWHGASTSTTGILLHGPPGCGKTKLAHAIANESGVPFYQISATEVLSAGTGSLEENIRNLFKNAYRMLHLSFLLTR